MATPAAPVLTPVVAEGLALIERCKAKAQKRDAKAAELATVTGELKALETELDAIDAQLIALGGGRYAAEETGRTVTVVPGFAQTLTPDTFTIPAGALETARTLAGPEFKRLFARSEIFAPKPGFEALAEILLTPKPRRELVALCLVPGKLAGGRAASVRWPK